jgi:hypothetical protein
LIKGKLRAKYMRARDKLYGRNYSYSNTPLSQLGAWNPEICVIRVPSCCPRFLNIVINIYVRILMLILLLRIEKADSCGMLIVIVRCQRSMVAMRSLAAGLTGI